MIWIRSYLISYIAGSIGAFIWSTILFAVLGLLTGEWETQNLMILWKEVLEYIQGWSFAITTGALAAALTISLKN